MNCSLDSNLTEEITTRMKEKISGLDTKFLSQELIESGKPKVIQFEFEIEALNLLSWLDAQSDLVKLYWSNRGAEFETAGVGVADSINGNSKVNYQKLFKYIHTILESGNKNLRYYGGVSFSDAHTPEDPWKALGSFRFILPQFQILRQANGTTKFGCNLVLYPGVNFPTQIQKTLTNLDKLIFNWEKISHSLPGLQSRENIPEFSRWNSILTEILDLIRKNELEKIVLARKTLLRFNKPLNPYPLLNRIKQTSPNCFHFCFQINKDLTFIGASPERLYKRQENKIFMEALAGTRARGMSAEEDHNLGTELLHSEKDHREHQFVVENLKRALRMLGCKAEINGKVSLLKLNQLQHLFLDCDSHLPKNITDADIITTLHPTSAVGGCPTDKAVEYIKSYEPFSRGWYAGPVGWIGTDASEFAVAIRSGLISGKQMAVYTGAGIIRGSNPNEEWQEIENKFDSFIGEVLI